MPHTLLLADDSLTIQRVIELTFADEDIRVVAVSDGTQALVALDRTPPDIVLADVGMPGTNGYEVARYIKDTPHLAHIPVLLLTGAFEPVDEELAAAVACDGVLAKPFEPQVVVARVKELLSKPKPDRTSVAGSPGTPTRGPLSARVDSIDPLRPNGSAPETLDEYFDRLDRAFAGFSSPPSSAPDLPLSYGSSEAGLEPSRSGGQVVDEVTLPRPAAPALSVPLPPLAEAFAALLAAEESVSGSPRSISPTASPWNREGLVDEVTRRVLERLSDRLVREDIAHIVSSVAERLVREEIERIKKSISDGDDPKT